ncbi:MAG TPA: diacylglycerol kinase family protein [Anaerolineales bacterium]|nr:diacylglycerol kinase family protein [Anaerolineales bacterium]
MTSACLLYNPSAGRGSARQDVLKIASGLDSLGWSVSLRESRSGDDTTGIARQAAEEKADVLIVAGGDGSIERSLAGLIGSKTALGVLPIGTSNVFAREIGLTVPRIAGKSIVDASLSYLRGAVVRPVDLGMCNGNPFLLWAGVGFDGYVIQNIEPRRRWEKKLGAPYYAARAASQARSWKSQALQIRINGDNIEDLFHLAVLSNIRLYAGGAATLSPDSCIDDGQMELWLFSGKNLFDLVRHAGDLMLGRHLKSDRVRCIPVQQLVLEAEEPLYIQLDGDPYETVRRVELQVIHRGINILVPPGKQAGLFRG